MPLSGFTGWKPSGILSATVVHNRDASVSSSRLSLGGCLASLVKFAKPKASSW